MKNILTILFLVASFASFGQKNDDTSGNYNHPLIQKGGWDMLTFARMPVGCAPYSSFPKYDSVARYLYDTCLRQIMVHNGTIWTAVTGGSFTLTQGHGITVTPNPATSTGTVKADTATMYPEIRASLPVYQPTGNYITSITGDGSATGPGAATLTLSTVNTNVGTFGSSSQVPVFVVNGKGLITGVSMVTIAAPWSGVTGAPAFITLSSLSASTPLNYNNSTGAFTIQQASTIQAGYLSAVDWNTFNNKQAALGFTAENVANKATSMGTLNNSLYPTTLALSNYVASFGYLTAATAASTYQPIGSYQAALSGTGFVKISGSTISYDNTSYYPASNPNGYTTNTGTVTSVSTGTGLTGGPVTTSGTISLANTTVTAASYTYGSFTVDAQGRLTAASSNTPVTSIIAGAGLSGGTITSTGTISMPNVGTAGTTGDATHVAAITTDAQGRVSGATSTLITPAYTNVTGTPTIVVTVNNVSVANNTAVTVNVVPGTASTASGGIVTIDGTQTITNKSIAASEVNSGQIAIANGGTNSTTANGGLNNLLPSQTGNSGKVLQSDGTNSSWATSGGSAATSVPTASTGSAWDGNVNIAANRFIVGMTTYTATGTQTIAVGAKQIQYFNGSTATLVLPVTSTLNGNGTDYFWVINNGSGNVTINSSGGNLVQTVHTGECFKIVCRTTGNTSATDWQAADYSPKVDNGGSVTFSSGITSSTISAAGGTSFFTGLSSNLIQSSSSGISASSIFSNASPGAQTLSGLLFGTGTSEYQRTDFYGNTSGTPLANADAANVVFGGIGITVPSTGTNSQFANVVVRDMPITSGTGTLTNAASFLIHGCPGVGINKYSLEIVGNSLASIDKKFTVDSFGTVIHYHSEGNGSTPTFSAGTGAGTSPTISISGNDYDMQVSVTTGTLPTGTNATVATITYSGAWSGTPHPVFSPANSLTAALSGVNMVYMDGASSTTYTITSGTTALTAATTYVWNVFSGR